MTMAITEFAILLIVLFVIGVWPSSAAPIPVSYPTDFQHPPGVIPSRHLHRLTLHRGVIVAGSRHLSQLICVAGSEKGGPNELNEATCQNVQYLRGDDPKWDCSPVPIQHGYTFSQMEVSCEPFNATEPHLVIQGSCLLRYRLGRDPDGAGLATTFIEVGAAITALLTALSTLIVGGRKWYKRRVARNRANLMDTNSVISDSTLATNDAINGERHEEIQVAAPLVGDAGTTRSDAVPPVAVSSIIDI